jgi:subtilisin family serine protease
MTALLRGLLIGLFCLLALASGAARAGEQPAASGELVEVVVGLSQQPLGVTRWKAGRQLQSRTLVSAQNRVADTIAAQLPDAQIRWHYKLVANGMAVVVPRSQLARLTALPGVAKIYPSVRYRPQLDRSVPQIGAPTLWGSGLENAGQGMKIAIIDEGIDQRHPFFSPAGYAMPAGYPKGQTAYTTAKVIVARAFPPAHPTWKNASKPFDREMSSHGTHVAGIAAGNNNTLAEGTRISGVAPRAYLGNYKALTIPTDADVGLDGNSPELAAAIEAAVADGMDVINMSLGEPEIEPSRDIVVQALAAAARAGVVSVVAAGNDFSDFGRGSIGSPGSAPDAITVGAVSTSRSGPEDVVASFSSSGPTPLSLRLKPEVSAPGVSIFSAAPGDSYASLSGTSMAAPHVAGGVALLLQRHPTWTPAQVKSALALTGDTAWTNDRKVSELTTVRAGGGVINLPRADNPLVFAAPVALSFGLVGPTTTQTQQIDLTDAGGGAGPWAVSLAPQSASPSAVVSFPTTVTVPGPLPVTVTTTKAPDAEATGYIVLSRGAEKRRIPYWFRTGAAKLANAKTTPLRRAGSYSSTTRGGAARITSYSYPDVPAGAGFATKLPGPERVFRLTLGGPATNFGVVVTSRAKGVRVEPRIVHAGDERRLTGYPALPFNLNPYLRTFGEPVLASGTILPAAGAYDIVFDSRTAASAGKFAFRFWINDSTPPAVALRSKRVRLGARLVVGVTDRGSGVDPASLVIQVDGQERNAKLSGGSVRLQTVRLRKGRHTLRFQVSDYQESRNMENVGPILPNTRILQTSFVVF